jgi:RNA polymerase sigma factor (sigma-70 family)
MTDWEGILEDEGPAVWRTLWRLLGNRADVEDCFQETFLSALSYARGEGVRHWCALLQKLATARGVDRLRQRYRSRRNLALDDTGEVESGAAKRNGPVEMAMACELSDRLRDALAKLPEQQAQAFCLHALSGWSYEEISRQTGMSSSLVGVNIHRARKQLGELLGEDTERASIGGVS